MGGIPNVSHVDAIYSDNRFHLILQDGGSVSTTQNTKGGRKLWLAKSSNGSAFTGGTKALIESEHVAQRMVYGTSGLHQIRNGKDFYRLWMSSVSYSVGASSADLANDAGGQGFMESYYIGYTQGYDTENAAAQDKTSLYLAWDVVAGGAVRGDEVGGNRGLFRFLAVAKG